MRVSLTGVVAIIVCAFGVVAADSQNLNVSTQTELHSSFFEQREDRVNRSDEDPAWSIGNNVLTAL